MYFGQNIYILLISRNKFLDVEKTSHHWGQREPHTLGIIYFSMASPSRPSTAVLELFLVTFNIYVQLCATAG
jgi:hypothetical protein